MRMAFLNYYQIYNDHEGSPICWSRTHAGMKLFFTEVVWKPFNTRDLCLCGGGKELRPFNPFLDICIPIRTFMAKKLIYSIKYIGRFIMEKNCKRCSMVIFIKILNP